MKNIALSWTLARRDWRAGELRLLLLALVVAVAAIASVGFFVDRMRQALSLEARQLLGADLVVVSDNPIPEAWRDDARARGLSSAETVTFPSMVLAGERTLLASIKAVSAGYPLRGRLRVAEAPNAPDVFADGVPERGTAWADAQVMQSLAVAPGGEMRLGESGFRTARVITLEPDRGANFVNFLPRVLIRVEDLAATRLIQPASRVSYRLLLAGERPQVEAFQRELKPRLARGQQLESIDSGRPEVRATLDRAERFLGLVALLSAMIAAVAIALASRRFAERHLDGCAVMRAIGVTQGRLQTLLGLELLWLAIGGGLIGVFAGWLIHFALVAVIAPLIVMTLPPPTVLPGLQAMAAGTVLLLGFGAWPFLRLAGVPPLRVLRRELGSGGASSWIAVVTALVAFVALLAWFAADRRLVMIAFGGFAGGTLVFVAVAAALVASIAPLRRLLTRAGAGAAVRLAMASWSRRAGASVAQLVALSVGLMALMLLTITRTDLIDSWRRASPADAPDRFVINIQPDQRADVAAAIEAGGIRGAVLYPMIRGRLVSINGRNVSGERYDDARAQRLVEREFNLSYGATLPSHNQVIAGRWFDGAGEEVSVEQGIAERLGLSMGDTLGFDVAGETVTAKVTSLRKLDWDSMKVNFFMILSPAALRDKPQTFVTSYHQPADNPAIDGALVQRFPNLTVFDTGNIVRQVQRMLDQVVLGVQMLFVLTLVAGLVVLYTAMAASHDERMRESGLMRALGASRQQLSRAQLWELGLSGGLAGLLAAIGSLAIGWVLADQVFGFEFSPRWLTLPLGALGGALLAVIAGRASLRGVLDAPPMSSLRNA